MTPALPISVFIIAKNEADRIPLAIRSVRDWVDEVIVIDSGSDDDTVGVSEGLGARTLHRDWTGYGDQKVFGEQTCKHDWILNIDADEEISESLRNEIIALFRAGEPPHGCYTLPILPIYNFQKRYPSPLTAHHHPIRLYNRQQAGFSDSTVHDSVIRRSGTVGHLKGMVNHRSFRSLRHHVDKVNSYSSAQADDLYAKGRNPSALTLIFTPPLAFLKSLLLRKEILNGVDGVIVSYMYAFQRFIRLAKARETFQQATDKVPDEKPGD